MTWQELGIKNYPEYFKLPHWKKLNDKYIFNNPAAQCWICGQKVRYFLHGQRETSNLLLHHVSYANLGRERYLVDIFILCWDCHTQTHFWSIFEIKTPLKKTSLLRRMYFLKGTKAIQRKKFALSILYLSLFTLI